MSDIQFVVTVDAAAGTAAIQKLDEQMNKLGRTTDDAAKQTQKHTESSSGMWKQFVTGQMVMNALSNTWQGFKDLVGDSVKAAIAQEDADNALRASLEQTGRTVQGNLEHYKNFAAEQQKVTKYGDEEIQQAQALMLTLARLGQDGMDKATKAAMGFASVMNVDLQSAATLVGKAMAGNTTALSRYGIVLEEGLSPQEKQAAVLEKLLPMYQRSQAEVTTFGGSVKQLKNFFGEVQESVGGAIIGNQDLRKAISDAALGLQKMVQSDRFKLWLSSLSEVISWTVKGIANITKAVVNLEEKLFGAKGWEKFIADNERAHGIMQDGVNVLHLRRQALNEDMLTVREWGLMFVKYGRDNQAMMKAIAEGKEGAELQALFVSLKDEGKKLADSQKNEVAPAINETGNALGNATDRGDELKKSLKLTFAEDVKKEIADINEALGTFGKRLTPDTVVELNKRLVELKDKLSGTKTVVFDVNAEMEKMGVKTVTQLIARDKELHAVAIQLNNDFASGAVDAANYWKGVEAIEKEDRALANTMKNVLPPANKKWTDIFVAAMGEMRASSKGMGDHFKGITQEMGAKWNEQIGKIKAVYDTYMSQMNDIFTQAQRNKEIEIENEYKKRLDFINATIKDEDARAKAITALEAEFEIKRTSAKRAAAKQQKAVALMGAVVNTAEAVTKSLAAAPWPFNIILAAMTAALGAVQIGLISRQPIPLAKGAVFSKPTLMWSNRGESYEVGEGGEAEILAPEGKMRSIMRSELQGFGGGRNVEVRVFIGTREIEDFVTRTVDRAIRTRRILVPGESVT